MPMTLSKKCRRNLALLLVAASVAVGGMAIRFADSAAQPVEDDGAPPSVVSCVVDGLRYEYHVPTGGESLHEIARDPNGLVNVLHDHEDVAAVCRRDLAARYGVSRLSDLRAGYADTIRRLHAVGYF
jgi:hypothetical protein